MITKEQYQEAVKKRGDAQEVLNAYHRQQQQTFEDRWEAFKKGQPFKPEEIRYSATDRCVCGAGLAYPPSCGSNHQWDCSKVLLQEVKTNEGHQSFPFAFYEIKSEIQPSAYGATTRPS